jgi:membrane protein DedA with SNARE-associated domain
MRERLAAALGFPPSDVFVKGKTNESMGWIGRGEGPARAWLAKRLPSLGGEAAEARVRAQYARHGLWALAVSRFIPAVRAVVPPLAGALGVGLGRAIVAMSLASALWYGLITWFAFTLGANADVLLETIGRSQRVLGGVALAIAIAAGVYFLRRR